jgi:hypothetical protein
MRYQIAIRGAGGPRGPFNLQVRLEAPTVLAALLAAMGDWHVEATELTRIHVQEDDGRPARDALEG